MEAIYSKRGKRRLSAANRKIIAETVIEFQAKVKLLDLASLLDVVGSYLKTLVESERPMMGFNKDHPGC